MFTWTISRWSVLKQVGVTGPLNTRCCALIEELGLGRAADVVAVTGLAGGVASDIARVDLNGQSFCVKFALPKLRVAADWFAPVHRSKAEYAWLQVAGRVAPGAAPRLFGYSEHLQGFAMEYIAGPDVQLWKTLLLSGGDPVDAASRVADILGRIHAAGSDPGFDRMAFDNAADFHALRVEPYLLFTAQRHPGLAQRLRALASRLDHSALTLVHGDVSPKNILLRGGQPVLLDAECATMGDPCFDVAFCINHLLLKSVHLPQWRAGLLGAVAAFWQAYQGHVCWEPVQGLESRVAALVPALMLARIDGKSPVEYLADRAKAAVRTLAIPLIADPVDRLDDLVAHVLSGGPVP